MKNIIKWYDCILGKYFSGSMATLNSICKEANCRLNENGYLSTNDYARIVNKWVKDKFECGYQSTCGIVRIDESTLYLMKPDPVLNRFMKVNYWLKIKF